MGKKYIGEFEAVNSKTYRIEIELSGGSGTTTLLLGESPFTTEMDVDDSQIYSPIKGSTATIGLLTEQYYFDIYSESPTGTKVRLYETTNGANNIVWSGYVTPQMFSQSFKTGHQPLKIDCIDSLSVLENIPYSAPEKEVLSFESILRKVLKSVDIDNLFVSTNVQISSATSNETVLDKFFISEMNFFDDKGEGQTDDDVCWKALDVVSEICQYLGYVAQMIGNDLYLLDYDAIRKGNPQYYRYNLNSTASPTLVTLSDTHKIVGTDHRDSDSDVSLDKIYNKVSVLADTYVFDELLNGSSDTNITNMDGSNFSSSYFEIMGIPVTDYIWGEVFPADDDQAKAMDVWVDAHNDAGGGNTGGKHTYYDFVAMKFLKRRNHKHYTYNPSWGDISSQHQDIYSYPILNKNNGAVFVKYYTKNLDKTKGSSYVGDKFREYYKEIKNNPDADSGKYLDYILDKNGIHSISWNEAIVMTNLQATQRPAESDWYKYPYYEMECEGSLIQGGDQSAMIIQGQFYWHCVGSSSSVDAYPMEYKDFKLDKKNWINPNVDMFIPAVLKWGDQYWNGVKREWQSEFCGFKLNWLGSEYRDDNNSKAKKENIEQWKCQKTVMQPQPLTNTVDWRFGTTEEGCLITMPKSGNLTGKPKLTLYRPVSGRVWKSRKDYLNGDGNGKLSGDYGTNNGVRWPWFFVALIGLKFKAIYGDQSFDGVNDTDTVYTNILENDSIEELEQISFKIHTFDDKQNSYGSVGLDGGSSFADKLYNKALYNEERTWYESTGGLATNGMRQEEHLIFKLVNQYTAPSKVLEANIKIGTIKPYGLYTDTALTDSYIVSTIGTDYKQGYDSVKLIEKK